MKLIVHIGTGKTGSSSIQKVLLDNSNELLQQGILYAGYMFDQIDTRSYDWQRHSGTEDFNQLTLEQRREQLAVVLQDAHRQAQQSQCSAIVWSNEALCNMPSIVAMIEAIWHGPVQIIGFVRRHDDYSVSAYKQWGLKHQIHEGEVPSYTEFFQRFPITFFDRLNHWNLPDWQFTLFNYHSVNVIDTFLQQLQVELDLDSTRVKENGGDSLAFLLYRTLLNSTPSDISTRPLKFINADIILREPDWFYAKLPTQEAVNALYERTHDDRQKLNSLLPPNQQFDGSVPTFTPYSKEDVSKAYKVVLSTFVDKIFLTDEKWQKQYKINDMAVDLKDQVHAQQDHIGSLVSHIHQLEAQLQNYNAQFVQLTTHIQRIDTELVAQNKALNTLMKRSVLARLLRKIRTVLPRR